MNLEWLDMLECALSKDGPVHRRNLLNVLTDPDLVDVAMQDPQSVFLAAAAAIQYAALLQDLANALEAGARAGQAALTVSKH